MEALASGARCPGDRGKREGRSLWSWCPESSQHRLSLPWASLGLEGGGENRAEGSQSKSSPAQKPCALLVQANPMPSVLGVGL